ncbi:hypothetical protein AgCh_005672 [Apium graveolens]
MRLGSWLNYLRGYTRKKGIDYDKVFSPVVKHHSIRVLLAMVALFDMEIEQLDVKTAFLHGELEETIYMTQPKGHFVKGKEDYVCKLKKSLYGLKQSPRQWYKRSGRNKEYLRHGDSADRTSNKVYLSQKSYIAKVLERFGMQNVKPVQTPLASHFRLSVLDSPQSEEDEKVMSQVPYSSAVGNMIYAMVCTRPDIVHAVSVVSKYMANPGKLHWLDVKWILQYLKGTTGMGLVFDGTIPSGTSVVGFVDSDYIGDLDKRRSLTCYLFRFSSSAISWRLTLQSTVALSTREAEYMVASEAVKEAIWLRNLMTELGIQQESKFVVFCDNQSALHLIKNQAYHGRTKHIDVKYHFIREVVSERNILVKKVSTHDNPADMLTKPVSGNKFKHCLNLSGVCL